MKLFKRPQRDMPRRRRSEAQPSGELDDTYTFRRGRTLTGSASSLVRSLSEVQADLKSSRVQAHELTKRRRRLAGVFALVVSVATVLYILISQFTAQAVVRASPDPTLQLDPVYAEIIDEYLVDRMSERLRAFTNVDHLTAYLQAAAPEVKSVRLAGSAGFGSSLFELTFREPIASWSVNNEELYVDANGVPFSRNYFSSPSLRITDQSGLTSALSSGSVMSNRFMSFVGQVIGLAKEQGYTATTVIIPEDTTRQIDIELKDVPYRIKFSSDRPAGEGVEDMVRAMSWMKSHNLTPEYVDVRVRGKVFYK